MIAAPHQQQFQLYSGPSRRALAGVGVSLQSPCVINALDLLPVGHAIPLRCSGVDVQSTTEDTACGATKVCNSNNPKAA